MNHNALVLTILILGLINVDAAVCDPNSTNVSTAFSEKFSDETETILSQMSLEEKIGQMFLIGVNGHECDEANQQKISMLKPGGVIFFGRNIKSALQVSHFLEDLQKEARRIKLPPLFMALDQEGGTVTRLKHWPPMPSAAAVGRAANYDLAYKLSLFSGQILRTLGFNMNLAPVLDLSDPARSSFIGSRAYGGNPRSVARFGAATIAGYEAAGILAISKHFPGHGSSVSDSHAGTPIVNRSLNYLKAFDLVPFETLNSSHQLSGIMTAHVAFPMVDSSFLPVTYSRKFLTQYLRTDLQYDGLILTDDLEMLGARGLKDPADRALQAINAGADIIMVAWNPLSQRRAYEGLIQAYDRKQLSIDRINESVRRILRTKLQFNLFSQPHSPTLNELKTVIFHRELHSAIDKIVLLNISRSFRETKRNTITGNVFLMTDDEAFAKSYSSGMKLDIPNIWVMEKSTNQEQFIRALEERPESETVLFYASAPSTIQFLNTLPVTTRSRLSLITTELPFLLKNKSEYKHIWYSYTRHPELGALFRIALSKSALAREARTPAIQQQKVDDGS